MEFAILLLYPHSYKDLIDDPHPQAEMPITYLGSAKKVAFFYYPDDRMFDDLTREITEHLHLTKEE